MSTYSPICVLRYLEKEKENIFKTVSILENGPCERNCATTFTRIYNDLKLSTRPSFF